MGRGFFTKENARHYALSGRAAQRLKREKDRAELQQLRDAPIVRILKAIQERSSATNEESLEAYVRERLARVRTQLDRLDAMILIEEDASKLDRLASAQTKLAEQERIMSGRPLPGSHRPTKAPKKLDSGGLIVPE